MKFGAVPSGDLPGSNTNIRVDHSIPSNHAPPNVNNFDVDEHVEGFHTLAVIEHCYTMKPQRASVDARY